MAVFNIGDRVRILSGREASEYYCGWNPTMENYVGTVQTVDRAYSGGVAFEDIPFNWDVRYLELVEKAETEEKEEKKVMETIMKHESTFTFTDEEKKAMIAKAMEFLPKYEYRSGCSYRPTEYALDKIITTHMKNKGWLYDLFKKHPNYNGKGQIVLSEQYSRKTDYRIINMFGDFIVSLMRRWNESIDNKVSHNFEVGEKVTIKSAKGLTRIWYDGMDKYVGQTFTIKEDWGDAYTLDTDEYILFDDECFVEERGEKEDKRVPFTREQMNFFSELYYTENAIQFADERLVEKINTAFPWVRAHDHQKVSRIVNRICKKYGFDKEEGFTRRYTQFADAINPLKVTRWTILSLNIFDYWTMSFGKDWQSCHTIDKTNLRRNCGDGYSGCYSAGTESYMLDGSSFVVYIISRDYNGDEFEFEDKLSRQMFHIGEDKLIQGRLYPQDNDTGASETYKEIREIVQRVIAECYGVDNLWTNKKGTDWCDEVTDSYGHHYRDYTCYDNCNVSFLKRDGSEPNMNRIAIGHNAICPQCGEEHDMESYIICDECSDELYCDECGRSVSRGDAIITSDGSVFCDSYCAERYGYVRCENNGEWMYGDNEHVFQDCYDENYYYDYWNERIVTEDGREYWDAENAELDGYCCTDDGEWYPEDEVFYCRECGRKVHESEWNKEMETCDDCAANNSIRVGTKIRVVDDGKIYSAYKEWLEENASDDDVSKFKFGESPANGDHGTIIAVGNHERSGKKLYGIEVNGTVYVIGYDGVEREVA